MQTLRKQDLYRLAILLALSIALLLVFGPSFGVIFAIVFMAFCYTILRCRQLYRVTQRRFYRRLYRLLSISLGSVLIILLTAAGFISSEYRANEGDSEELDYVIILGAGLRGMEPSITLKGRLDAGLEYMNLHHNVPIILSGGRGPGEHTTEAEAMASYLTSMGIPKERLILEDRSSSTEQNVAFSKLLMNKKHDSDLRVLIITSDYHLFRAKQIAKESGYIIYGKASPSPILLGMNYTVRECFGVVQLFLKSVLNG